MYSRTHTIYNYINIAFLVLGLVFFTTEIASFQFSLFIATSGVMLFLILFYYYPNTLWFALSFIAFYYGIIAVLNVDSTLTVIPGLNLFIAMIVFVVFLLILRPPIEFINGFVYTFWILLLTYIGIGLFKHDVPFSLELFHTFDLILYIIEEWGYLLLLGGYITSVIPLYANRLRPEKPWFFYLSGIVVYLNSILLQIIAGIVFGLYRAIVNYIRHFKSIARKQTKSEASSNDEPAFENYWLKKVFIDWKDVLFQSIQAHRSTQAQLYRRAKRMTATYGIAIGAIPFTVLFVASISALVLGSVLTIIVNIIYLIVVSIISGPTWIYYLIFKTYDTWYTKKYKVATICPNCYEKSTLPNYSCHICGEIHSDLRPSLFGIRKRTCTCGTKLPTTALDQRYKLEAHCKQCRAPLKTEEATPFCVSVIGGPSTGKTAFVVSAVNEITEKVAPSKGWNIDFLQAQDEEYFNLQASSLKIGRFPHKTAKKEPFAYNLKISSNEWKKSKLLYIYDPAGEVYRNSQELSSHSYLEYVDGYVLMIDPFSIPELAMHYDDNTNLATVNPSDTLPEDAYGMLMIHLAKKYQIKKEEQISTPLAVVINKVDAFDIEQQIAATKVQVENSGRSGDEDTENLQVLNEQCKTFLRNIGYQTFVNRIESKFTNVQFFPSSSLPTKRSDDISCSRVFTWLMEQK